MSQGLVDLVGDGPSQTRAVHVGSNISFPRIERVRADRIYQANASHLADMINRAFTPDVLVDGYFKSLEPGTQITMYRGSQGVAIVSGKYLDIIAVDPQLQGKGIGKELMESILRDGLHWRSKTSRPQVNKWYESLAGPPVVFTSEDGIEYNGYGVRLSERQMLNRAMTMAQKPSNYKQP